MAKYLLIESRDPFETNDVGYFYDLAAGLAQKGNTVTLFLVQNGVLPARRSPGARALAGATSAGNTIARRRAKWSSTSKPGRYFASHSCASGGSTMSVSYPPIT